VFVNTAWTLQLLRGVILTLATLAVAYPCAVIYEQPLYWPLLSLMGVSTLLAGVTSMSVPLLQRRLEMGKVVVLQLATAAFGTAVTLVLAAITRSLWAIPIGLLGSSAFMALVSHMVSPGVRMRVAWDWSAAAEIVHFGKWIFGSSVVMFISRTADKFSLAKLLPRDLGVQDGMARLQVYNMALLLSEIAAELATAITYNVLFPAYSRVVPEGIERVRDVYYRSRTRLDAFCLLSGGVSGAAPWIVAFIFDDRYLGVVGPPSNPYSADSDARWMLSALALRAGMMCMLVPCESVLFSLGHSRYSFWRNLARAVWVMAGVPLGWHLGGMTGVIGVMALTEVPVLLVLWPAAVKHRVFRWRGELQSVALLAAGFGLGWLFLQVMPEVRVGAALRHLAEVFHLTRPK
jgi:O-antigen/teichoic acid export membrane protein